MARAEVGDDVYGEDPTVRELEERVAGLFGHEAALFTPTGSMANVLAVRSLVAPGQEVLCEASAHIARAELGAHGAYTGLTMRTWVSPRGEVDLATIRQLYAPDMGPFFVPTAAISVENTHNFAGGAVLPARRPPGAARVRHLGRRARAHGRRPGLERARRHRRPARDVRRDRRRACRSACPRGSARPIGSLMVGSADAIAEARVWRKRMGGGMRQVGILAAAGLHALDHHVDRLADDHAHARLLAEACGVDPATVDTNIVVVPHDDPPAFVAAAREGGVLVGGGRPRRGPDGHPPRRHPRRRRAGRQGAGRPLSPARRAPDPPPSANGDPRLECRRPNPIPGSGSPTGESLHVAFAQDRLGARRAGTGRSHALARRVVGRRRPERRDLPAAHELQADRVQGPGRPAPLLRRRRRHRRRAVRAEDAPKVGALELDDLRACPRRPAAPSASPCSAPS